MQLCQCKLPFQGHSIPAEPTLVNMSRSELSFALLVEEALVRVESPARRQLCVELLCVVATILRRNPELTLRQPLDLDKLLDDAHLTYAKVGLYICKLEVKKITLPIKPALSIAPIWLAAAHRSCYFVGKVY